MDLELETLVRKRFYVGSIKVTEENMQTVANWCGGRINSTPQDAEKGQRRYIRMPVPRNRNVRGRAFAGDYILQLGDSFRAYTESSVWEFFERPGSAPKEHKESRVGASVDNRITERLIGDAIYDEKTDSLRFVRADVSISAKEAAKRIDKLFKEEKQRIEFETLVKTLIANGPGSFERYILVYFLDGIEIGNELPEGHDCFKNSCVVTTEPSINFFDYRTVYKIFHKDKTEITEAIDLKTASWHMVDSGEAHLTTMCHYIGCNGV